MKKWGVEMVKIIKITEKNFDRWKGKWVIGLNYYDAIMPLKIINLSPDGKIDFLDANGYLSTYFNSKCFFTPARIRDFELSKSRFVAFKERLREEGELDDETEARLNIRRANIESALKEFKGE